MSINQQDAITCVMVASTPAACSPPITEIRALGHMYRNLSKEISSPVEK